MDIVLPLAEAYASKYTTAEDALLAEVHQYTLQQHPKAHMLSGHTQGAALQMLSSIMQPQRILEIGTFTGYSALCLAKGLAPNGMLHTIESRPEEATIAQNFINRSCHSKQIKIHIGDAHQLVETLNETWDLVFLDADKTGYVAYLQKLLPRMRKGGLIVADNVLFHGEVLQEKIQGKNAIAIQHFNDFVKSCKEVEHVLLPVRDGLMLIRKIS